MVEYPQIKSAPLSERVCEQIKKMVLSGELPPGTRLNEQAMAKQMKVNRSAIREAFRILGQTGLIKYIPYKGTFITNLSKDDIYELASLRAILEGYAAELAVKNAKDYDVEKMKLLMDEMLGLSKEGKMSEVIKKDLEFHEFIWKLSGNRYLLDILLNMKTRIQLFFQLYSTVNIDAPSDVTESIDMHQDIIEAFIKKSPEIAKEILSDHVTSSANYVIRAMEGKAGALGDN